MSPILPTFDLNPKRNMITTSLHGIAIHAKIGLYPEEKIKGNDFEIDVDVTAATQEGQALPFIDYAVIHEIVQTCFEQEGELLETFALAIHSQVKQSFPFAEKIKVAIRKLNPPLGKTVKYSQVEFED